MSNEKTMYDKLTPQRQKIIDEVLKNLSEGTGLWKPGWKSEVPESFSTKKPYRGINNFYLTLVSMANGYQDNRWLTYHQIESNGYSFKKDEEGNSLGKGKGVTVEFFEFRDKNTKKAFDRKVLEGMTLEEKEQYVRDNLYAHRRYYRVFNGDLVEGLPKKEETTLNETEKNVKAENILDYWSKNESPIIYGGSNAYYIPSFDEIHLPERSKFISYSEFYSTALHEVGHSTGHEKRLNRDLGGGFGTPSYATEELRAEIASMFIEQELGITIDENHIQNNSAYIKHWYEGIKDDPNILFNAIADADKISKYVISKEKTEEKKIEHYAIVESENAYGEIVYKAYTTTDKGATALLVNHGFASVDALRKEIDKMSELDYYKDSTFKEVSIDELNQISLDIQNELNIEEAKSLVFVKPSEVASNKNEEVVARKIDMSERGINSLTRMSDKDVIEKAMATKDGEKFKELYEGKSILGNSEKDALSLMNRLAMFTGGDTEQLLRIFKSSGQFNENKPMSFYERLAERATNFIKELKAPSEKSPKFNIGSKRHFGLNSKT